MAHACVYSLNPYLLENSHGLDKLTLLDFNKWCFNGSVVRKSGLDKNIDFPTYVNIIEEIKSSYPIFARHFTELSVLEIAIRQLALDVTSLIELFKDKSFSYLIIDTSSVHHIDTLVCQLAARFSNIPQVFLFPLDFKALGSPEIIPLIQLDDFSDRHVLPIKFTRGTSFQYENMMSTDRVPILTYSREHEPVTDIKKARLMLFRESISQIIRAIRRQRPEYLPYGSHLMNPYSVRDISRYLTKQKNNLKNLDKFIQQDRAGVRSLLIRVQSDPNLIALVIYGQWQPEASTFPDGRPFYNYIDLALYVRSKGFKGPLLFKEHPAMRFFFLNKRFSRTGISRSWDFYETLRDLGCLFLADDDDLHKLENVIPVTSTGSISIERAKKNLPSIVLGHPWYRESKAYISKEEFEHFCEFGVLPEKQYSDLFNTFMKEKIRYSAFSKVPLQNDDRALRDSFDLEFLSLLEVLDENFNKGTIRS